MKLEHKVLFIHSSIQQPNSLIVISYTYNQAIVQRGKKYEQSCDQARCLEVHLLENLKQHIIFGEPLAGCLMLNLTGPFAEHRFNPSFEFEKCSFNISCKLHPAKIHLINWGGWEIPNVTGNI